MRILVVGAGGYLGAAIARRCSEGGHDVSVLARDAERAKAFSAAGWRPVTGDLAKLVELRGEVDRADSVAFAASIPWDWEWPVFSELLGMMKGTDKPFVITTGTGVLSHETPHGEWREETYAEDDPFSPQPWIKIRVETETKVRAYAAEGVRTIVMRPPQIWGAGGSKQIPAVFASAANTGNACYVGKGLNLYSHVHVDDLAEAYRLALVKGQAGALYHAVAGEVNWRTIAEAVSKVMRVETRSVTIEESKEIWSERLGPLFFGVSSRSRSPRAHKDLGWVPTRVDLIEDVLEGSYSEVYRAVR